MGKLTHTNVGATLTKAEWEAQPTHLIGGVADLNIVRGATLVVAASNASAASKAQADYVCGDGTYPTDDQYVNAAILALSGQGIVHLSGGTFVASASINTRGNIIIEGEGRATIIKPADGSNIYTLRASVGSNFIVKDLALDGNRTGGATGYSIIRIDDATLTSIKLQNLWIINGNTAGIYAINAVSLKIVNCDISDITTFGIYISQTNIARYGLKITGCDISGCSHGIYLEGVAGTYREIDGVISNSLIHDNSAGGIAPKYVKLLTISANSIYRQTAGDGIIVDHSADIDIVGNNISRNLSQGIDVSDGLGINMVGNDITENGNAGILLNGMYYSGAWQLVENCLIASNAIVNNGWNAGAQPGIQIESQCNNNIIANNQITNTVGLDQEYGIKFVADDNGDGIRKPTGNIVRNNYLSGNELATILNLDTKSTDTILDSNLGHIGSGEIRHASSFLVAGNANAIAFAWHNPEVQDILIKKVMVEITTAGGTPGSHLDVGIADDATGTNRGAEFFDDLLLNTVQIDDSWVGGDGGTQTKWVFCEDSASATDGWIVGQILDANAASLVGKYYIEYVGR